MRTNDPAYFPREERKCDSCDREIQHMLDHADKCKNAYVEVDHVSVQ